MFLRRCERLTGFSWIVDDAVTVGYLLFFPSTKEYRKIFNSIYWCLVKLRQVCACSPCRQRGIAANNPLFCPCGSRFSFQRHPCKLSGAISTRPLCYALGFNFYVKGIAWGMKDLNISNWGLVEQINRKIPKLPCEVSSALRLGSPKEFSVILRKRWCSVWHNMPVRHAQDAFSQFPPLRFPALEVWKTFPCTFL